MNKNVYSSVQKKAARIIPIVSGFLFCLFSLFYLIVFQCSLLEARVNSLFDGNIHYIPWLGGILITAVLFFLQRIIARIQVKRKWYSFTYLPSYIILGVLTYYKEFYIPVFMLLLLAGLLFLITRPSSNNKRRLKADRRYYILRYLNINILEIIIMCIITVSIGNTNRNLHYELGVNKAIENNKNEIALLIGKYDLKPSQKLSVLRSVVLSKTNQVGDKLFEYPQLYGIDGLVFSQQTEGVEELGFSPGDLYRYLGLSPNENENTIDFLERLYREDPTNIISREYLLAGYLLLKDLDKFHLLIKEVYPPGNTKMPKYYLEAIVLYRYIHSEHSSNDYPDYETIFDSFQNYLRLEDGEESPIIIENRIRKDFGHTYWWYYYYQ